MEEEYAVFLEGTGLDIQPLMEEERKNNPDCNRVCTANEMMLDILRKYQQIAQILDNWKSDGGDFEMSESYWLRLISEVLEDGNDD